MARFTGVYAAAPALAGILAAFVSFQYFEPAHRSLSVPQSAPDSPWPADIVRTQPETRTARHARRCGQGEPDRQLARPFQHRQLKSTACPWT